MTPEAFISSKFANDKFVYTFKNLRDVQTMCGKRINFILYEKLKRLLKPLLQLCEEAQMPASPTMPLTLPAEHTILRMIKKGCSHLCKLYRKAIEFDITDWKHMQNGTEMSALFNVHYAPYEVEKIISQVYTSNTVPHARDIQISSETTYSPGRIFSTKTLFPLPSVDSALDRKKHCITGLSHVEQANLSGAS